MHSIVLGLRRCVALACLLGACKGGPLVVAEGMSERGTSGGDSNAPAAQRCADPAVLRAQDAECWPTRHVGRWHGFVTGDARYWSAEPTPLEYPSDDVLLEIDASGSARLRFSPGDAAAPSACASETAPAPCTLAPGILPGFAYALSSLRMTGGPNEDRRLDPRVDFSLRIAEPWAAYCEAFAAVAGPCTCSAEGCGVSPQSLQGSLEVSEDGRALRGSARTTGASEDLIAGWEFVRE